LQNDGFLGNNLVQGNLVFNMVRETSDHGPFNSCLSSMTSCVLVLSLLARVVVGCVGLQAPWWSHAMLRLFLAHPQGTEFRM